MILWHSKDMSDEHTLTLQDNAADRNCRSQHDGKHYRQVAHWLRGVAAKCRVPDPQRELLGLARRYDRRADQFERP
jgi:hypothetical protein